MVSWCLRHAVQVDRHQLVAAFGVAYRDLRAVDPLVSSKAMCQLGSSCRVPGVQMVTLPSHAHPEALPKVMIVHIGMKVMIDDGTAAAATSVCAPLFT